ncbi:MAG: hypothetical protein ACREX7_05580 [Casimicrobiaceae bacterium]
MALDPPLRGTHTDVESRIGVDSDDKVRAAHSPRPHPPVEEPEEQPDEHAPETEPDERDPDPTGNPPERPPRPGKSPR